MALEVGKLPLDTEVLCMHHVWNCYQKSIDFPTKNTILRHYVDIVGLKDPISFFLPSFHFGLCHANKWLVGRHLTSICWKKLRRQRWSLKRHLVSTSTKMKCCKERNSTSQMRPWRLMSHGKHGEELLMIINQLFLFHYNPFLGISFLSSSLWQDVIKKFLRLVSYISSLRIIKRSDTVWPPFLGLFRPCAILRPPWFIGPV